MNKILVVDDEKSMRELLHIVLTKEKYHVDLASNGQDAQNLLRNSVFDLVISDIRMNELSGVDVLRFCKEVSPETLVILVTAYASAETAIDALKYGAYDYLTKPFNVDELKNIVRNALEKKLLRQEVEHLKKELQFHNKLIGKSSKMIELCKMIGTVAATDSTILLTGESGTGKELVARAIHEASDRKKEPFISINCGAFPETLLESELFGYMKGAFTGANSNKKGLFEVADTGTIFLDEVGETSLTMQVKLLRVLQERKIRRVGGAEEIPVDVRVIVATNKDLEKLIAEKTFREDLYYRIAVIPIHVPPLRERQQDIVLLANYFLEKYAQKTGKNLKGISEEAFRTLERYSWPGNVRELENVVERAVALEQTNEIQPERLPDWMRGIARKESLEMIMLSNNGINLDSYLQEMEKNLILQALAKTKWNRKKAADMLKVTYRSLRHRMFLHNIKRF
ncbi:MAG: sigma-54-dependent Fis family transcriptional regulator [Acidobacteria bacterium]|nr:sigma-54-dependent Fis family transcriptional regulator [Acidobacteriota bacterium]